MPAIQQIKLDTARIACGPLQKRMVVLPDLLDNVLQTKVGALANETENVGQVVAEHDGDVKAAVDESRGLEDFILLFLECGFVGGWGVGPASALVDQEKLVRDVLRNKSLFSDNRPFDENKGKTHVVHSAEQDQDSADGGGHEKKTILAEDILIETTAAVLVADSVELLFVVAVKRAEVDVR